MGAIDGTHISNLKWVQKIVITSRHMATSLIVQQQWIAVEGSFIYYRICLDQQMMHVSYVDRVSIAYLKMHDHLKFR